MALLTQIRQARTVTAADLQHCERTAIAARPARANRIAGPIARRQRSFIALEPCVALAGEKSIPLLVRHDNASGSLRTTCCWSAGDSVGYIGSEIQPA